MNASALVEWIAATGPVTVLTGAGMSTDSGIPDYRGSGVDRRRRPPIAYREFMRDPAARQRYWARSHVGYGPVARAQPNAGHRAVTALQRNGMVGSVITQNVDGLHDAAGTTDVLELHGRLARVVCTDCGDLTPRRDLADRMDAANPRFVDRTPALAPDGDAQLADDLVEGFVIPDCRRCGGVLKPDVVFFGESMPRTRRDRAASRLGTSAGLLVLGSSLAVMSGYRLVLQAAGNGQSVAILTRGPSRGDHLADLRVDAGLTETLTAVLTEAVTGTVADPLPAAAGTAARRSSRQQRW